MGLGKTIQAIAALRILFQRAAIQRVLVVVPTGLLSQWRGEFWQWAPEIQVIRVQGDPAQRRWQWQLDKQVFLVSYDGLRNDEALARRQPGAWFSWTRLSESRTGTRA